MAAADGLLKCSQCPPSPRDTAVEDHHLIPIQSASAGCESLSLCVCLWRSIAFKRSPHVLWVPTSSEASAFLYIFAARPASDTAWLPFFFFQSQGRRMDVQSKIEPAEQSRSSLSTWKQGPVQFRPVGNANRRTHWGSIIKWTQADDIDCCHSISPLLLIRIPAS